MPGLPHSLIRALMDGAEEHDAFADSLAAIAAREEATATGPFAEVMPTQACMHRLEAVKLRVRVAALQGHPIED